MCVCERLLTTMGNKIESTSVEDLEVIDSTTNKVDTHCYTQTTKPHVVVDR